MQIFEAINFHLHGTWEMMKFKWLHSKATYVTLFLEESQELEAWNKLSFRLDLGKKDLGPFFLYCVKNHAPKLKEV